MVESYIPPNHTTTTTQRCIESARRVLVYAYVAARNSTKRKRIVEFNSVWCAPGLEAPAGPAPQYSPANGISQTWGFARNAEISPGKWIRISRCQVPNTPLRLSRFVSGKSLRFPCHQKISKQTLFFWTRFTLHTRQERGVQDRSSFFRLFPFLGHRPGSKMRSNRGCFSTRGTARGVVFCTVCSVGCQFPAGSSDHSRRNEFSFVAKSATRLPSLC